MRNADFGMRISRLRISDCGLRIGRGGFHIPQSAIRDPQFIVRVAVTMPVSVTMRVAMGVGVSGEGPEAVIGQQPSLEEPETHAQDQDA